MKKCTCGSKNFNIIVNDAGGVQLRCIACQLITPASDAGSLANVDEDKVEASVEEEERLADDKVDGDAEEDDI